MYGNSIVQNIRDLDKCISHFIEEKIEHPNSYFEQFKALSSYDFEKNYEEDLLENLELVNKA